MKTLLATRFESETITASDMTMAVGALFNVPVSENGQDFVSTLRDISRKPKMAIGTFVDAAITLNDAEVVTRFGAMAGLQQGEARKRVHAAVEVLTGEIKEKFSTQYAEVARSNERYGGR